MNYPIKVSVENISRISIEADNEIGELIRAFLLKKNYYPIDCYEIGKSENEPFDLSEPNMKYFSLMTLSQSPEIKVEIIAKLLQEEFGGYLYNYKDVYYITSEPKEFFSSTMLY